jgi:hypothetical protein
VRRSEPGARNLLAAQRFDGIMELPRRPLLDTTPAADVMAEEWASAGIDHVTSYGVPGVEPPPGVIAK